jgi:3-oxoacyl-[acyl-carrier protein] reductase
VDVLVHNAGIYPDVRLVDMTVEDWDRVHAVNLRGTFLAVKAVLPVMLEQGKGRIVITSSITGPRVGNPGLAHYSASKAGVNGFIKTAAIELARSGITVNAVEPGNILTPGMTDVLGADYIRDQERSIPMGTLGTPEDIAYAMLYLASDEAAYVTGQSIVVDGGQILPESLLDVS